MRSYESTLALIMLVAFGAAGLLTGCGNAYQHLTMGEWREVGQAGSPVSPGQSGKAAFIVTTLDPGEGPPVRAGDLVRAQVSVTTVNRARDGSSYTNSMPPQVMWVWTGREPSGEPQPGWSFATYGGTGDAQSRAMFIGHRLHGQFELQGAAGHRGNWGELPLRVFIDYRFSRMLHGASVTGHYFLPPEWPALYLEDNAIKKTSARIEILAICRDAKLYRRTAVLTQYGMMGPSFGGPAYQTKRRGILGWSALEAQCPEGPIRIQAGPFYDFELQDETHLSDWGGSYAVVRSPNKHPQEWCEGKPSASAYSPSPSGQPRPCAPFPEWLR